MSATAGRWLRQHSGTPGARSTSAGRPAFRRQTEGRFIPTDTAPTVPTWVDRDPEWAAALHVLRAPALRDKGVMRFVDFDGRRIDFCELLQRARPWSAGERTLVAAAAALFGGLRGCELRDLVSDLDDGNLRRALEAIEMHRVRSGR